MSQIVHNLSAFCVATPKNVIILKLKISIKIDIRINAWRIYCKPIWYQDALGVSTWYIGLRIYTFFSPHMRYGKAGGNGTRDVSIYDFHLVVLPHFIEIFVPFQLQFTQDKMQMIRRSGISHREIERYKRPKQVV